MRIVTGQAANARIGSVEALAVRQPVRLEAYVDYPPSVASHHCFPAAMTLTAEARYIFGRHFAELRWSGIELSLQGVEQMSIAAHVTMLAPYAWLHGIEVQLAVLGRVGGMTAKAILRFTMQKLAPECFFQRVRGQRGVPDRDIQTLNVRVVTYQAFIPLSLPLENPRLRAVAEAPVNRRRDRTLAVGYAKRAVVAPRLHRVGVVALAKCHFRIRLECGIRTGKQQKSPPHRRLRLARSFRPVATRTRGAGTLRAGLRLRRHARHRNQDRGRNQYRDQPARQPRLKAAQLEHPLPA